jgi:hypothetical protein
MKLVNELRIGNLVEIIQSKKGIYTTIQASCFSVDIEKHYKPIKLSDYFDFKFDFIEISYENKMRVQIYKSSNVIVFTPNGVFSFENYKVHQLQNLYFSLTGEELTLKP